MSRPEAYLLVGREIKPCTMDEWAAWFETATDRHVADTEVGDVRISTVFMGLDHNDYEEGPPLVFETMIFGGPRNHELRRYSSFADALAGHNAMVDHEREWQHFRQQIQPTKGKPC